MATEPRLAGLPIDALVFFVMVSWILAQIFRAGKKRTSPGQPPTTLPEQPHRPQSQRRGGIQSGRRPPRTLEELQAEMFGLAPSGSQAAEVRKVPVLERPAQQALPASHSGSKVPAIQPVSTASVHRIEAGSELAHQRFHQRLKETESAPQGHEREPTPRLNRAANGLRQGILWHEVLGPPVALRPPQEY